MDIGVQSDRVLAVRFGRNRRGGASAIELAISLPLLLLLIFGVIEFGRAIMVHQVLVNASREAARRAVVPGATDSQVLNTISGYMSAAGITGYTTTVKIDGTEVTMTSTSTHITNAASKSSIGIGISVPHSNVSFGIVNLLAGDRKFAASTLMRKE